MKSVRDIENFGEIAAEDDDIQRFFVQTPVYETITKGERQVVVGRKGAGKTALYLALTERTVESGFSCGLTFKDYPWALHARYAHEATTKHERFSASWRFLTFMEVFKLLLTDEQRGQRYADKNARIALGQVEKFIQKNWGVIAFDYKKTFPSGGFKFDGVQVAPQAFGFAAGAVNINRQGTLSDTLDRLNEWLWLALQAVGRSAPTVYVLYDELDAGYDPVAEDYLDRVIGLLLAVRRLSREFRDAGIPVFPIAFLRSDIYDRLHFGDKNKLTDRNATYLSWNDDLTYSGCSLKQLIDHRIRESLELTSGVREPWSKVFDAAVMRGTQHKFNHMTFRTYLRPRDIIKFANCALEQAKRRMRANGGGLITNDDVTNARKDYSRYLLRELDDEIAPSAQRWTDYVELLRRIQVTRFTFQAFEAAYTELSPRVPLDRSPAELLEFMYRYSIIGFERSPGGAGLEQHFHYQDETIRFNLDARAFMVHRGLKEALELRDSGDAKDALD